jgi:RNA polymerase sigma factor (TIGR02999 family)
MQMETATTRFRAPGVSRRMGTVPMAANSSPNSDLSALLIASESSADAASKLLEALYGELRAMAEYQLRHESPGQTLQATALVHEAYLKLVRGGERNWNGRNHFFAAAAQAMRRILVDHARARNAQKRGGEFDRVDLSAVMELPAMRSGVDLVELDGAMKKLAEEDSVAARIVEMRFFSGMEEAQIALALGMSDRTVRRRWRYARAWLYRALEGTDLIAGSVANRARDLERGPD